MPLDPDTERLLSRVQAGGAPDIERMPPEQARQVGSMVQAFRSVVGDGAAIEPPAWIVLRGGPCMIRDTAAGQPSPIMR